jgi:LPS-assembly lipoprotein
MSRSYITYILILLSLFLTGCGFTLRTAKSLPPQLHQIYYQTDNPYGQFEITLKRTLKASNVILLPAPNATTSILHVTSNYNYSTTSSISSAAGRVYTLNYNATISINGANDKLLLYPQAVTVSRTVTLRPNEVFEVTPQVEITKQEMLQELARKILNILCAEKTFKVLAKKQ